MTTLYWCKVFKAPTLNSKHHIIGFEPLIGEHYSSMVHHIVMHECELDDDEDLAIWEQFAKEDGKLCHSNRATLWDKCLTPLVSWAIGSKGKINLKVEIYIKVKHFLRLALAYKI